MARIPYEANHKTIKGVEHKLCNDCGKWYPLNSENFYQIKNKNDGYHNYCKSCYKLRVNDWQKDNKDKMRGYFIKCDSTERRKKIKSEHNKKQASKRKFKEWVNNNPEKIKSYQINRKSHKTHEINKEEWQACKEYFNNSCAYCGISEEKAKELQGNNLHKEHVLNYGANDLSNCVPACKECNSNKWLHEFEAWYTVSNERYSKERYEKIISWLQSDYKQYIQQDITK
jgi:HNH endonuclease